MPFLQTFIDHNLLVRDHRLDISPRRRLATQMSILVAGDSTNFASLLLPFQDTLSSTDDGLLIEYIAGAITAPRILVQPGVAVTDIGLTLTTLTGTDLVILPAPLLTFHHPKLRVTWSVQVPFLSAADINGLNPQVDIFQAGRQPLSLLLNNTFHNGPSGTPSIMHIALEVLYRIVHGIADG